MFLAVRLPTVVDVLGIMHDSLDVFLGPTMLIAADVLLGLTMPIATCA